MRRPLIKMMMLAAVAIVASLVGAPAQASAATGEDFRGTFRVVSYFGSCLDSNYAGDVYVLPCSDRANYYQDWELYFGGWAINKQTRRCLTLKPGWYLRTELSCDWGNPYQEWKHWSGGWFQNHYDNACIEWHPSYGQFGVKAQACLWNYAVQHWFERTPPPGR